MYSRGNLALDPLGCIHSLFVADERIRGDLSPIVLRRVPDRKSY